MTPQRAQALEAELRRVAALAMTASLEAYKENRALRSAVYDGREAAYTHAADLVRDAAKEG